MEQSKVRVFVDQPLGEAQTVAVSADQAHYLFGVMRLSVGDVITVFNWADGAWSAEIVDAAKRRGMLLCKTQTAPQHMPPDLWLLFAPIKKARTYFIV